MQDAMAQKTCVIGAGLADVIRPNVSDVCADCTQKDDYDNLTEGYERLYFVKHLQNCL